MNKIKGGKNKVEKFKQLHKKEQKINEEIADIDNKLEIFEGKKNQLETRLENDKRRKSGGKEANYPMGKSEKVETMG